MLHTQVHQSANISLRPFSMDKDSMRGMESSIVGDPTTLAKHFDVTEEEAATLAQSTLPWLHGNNVWYKAYRASYQMVKDLETFLKTRPESGYLMPVLPSSVTTDTGAPAHTGVSESVLGVLVPTDDFHIK